MNPPLSEAIVVAQSLKSYMFQKKTEPTWQVATTWRADQQCQRTKGNIKLRRNDRVLPRIRATFDLVFCLFWRLLVYRYLNIRSKNSNLCNLLLLLYSWPFPDHALIMFTSRSSSSCFMPISRRYICTPAYLSFKWPSIFSIQSAGQLANSSVSPMLEISAILDSFSGRSSSSDIW